MVDIKAKTKHRNKIKKMVEMRMKETGEMDEKLIRKSVNKELRAKRKLNKKSNHEEVAKIKLQVQESMGKICFCYFIFQLLFSAGKSQKEIDKALKKAEARYFADLRQSKKPHNVIKKKANELRLEINGQLWYPNVSQWWDSECEKKFEDIQLLASMWEIDLLKAPKKFGELYPDVCKKYFDFLAKKRFNAPSDSKDENSDEIVKIKKSKSSLQKLYDEKKGRELKAMYFLSMQ